MSAGVAIARELAADEPAATLQPTAPGADRHADPATNPQETPR